MHRMPKSSALGLCERGLNFKRSTWLPCVQFPLLIPHDSRFASYVMQTGPLRGERLWQVLPLINQLPKLSSNDVRMAGASSDDLGLQDRLHVHAAPVPRRLAGKLVHVGGGIDKFASTLRAARS